MSDSVIQLVPGYLVVVSTRVEGGCRYQKYDLEAPQGDAPPEAEVKRWETTKTVIRPEEFKEASRVRVAARKLITGACISTPFGFLMCPNDRLGELDAKIAEQKEMVRTFNLTAVESRVRVSVMRGEIAKTVEEAAAAVQGEVGTLLRDLEEAISAGQVTTIRDLSDRLKSVGKLIESKSAARGALDKAVAAARKVARDVKRAAAAGESVADILEQAQTRPVSQARFLFAETPEEAEALRAAAGEDPEPDGQELLPGVSLQRFAGLDAGGGEAEAEEVEETVTAAGVTAFFDQLGQGLDPEAASAVADGLNAAAASRLTLEQEQAIRARLALGVDVEVVEAPRPSQIRIIPDAVDIDAEMQKEPEDRHPDTLLALFTAGIQSAPGSDEAIATAADILGRNQP